MSADLPSTESPTSESRPPRDLHLLTERSLPTWLATQSAETRNWLQSQGFTAERHRVVLLPAAQGAIGAAVCGLGAASLEDLDPWWLAALPDRLPAGHYQLATELPAAAATAVLLGWRLGSYRLARWRSGSTAPGSERGTSRPLGR